MTKDCFGRDRIVHAIVEGRIDEFMTLADALDDPDVVDVSGWTLLHFAAQDSHPEVAHRLVQLGADVNRKDKHGNSPLWTATFNARGTYDVVRILVDAGADVSSRNNAGRSPLGFAKTIQDEELIKILRQGL